jgi:hypothetical protein
MWYVILQRAYIQSIDAERTAGDIHTRSCLGPPLG